MRRRSQFLDVFGQALQPREHQQGLDLLETLWIGRQSHELGLHVGRSHCEQVGEGPAETGQLGLTKPRLREAEPYRPNARQRHTVKLAQVWCQASSMYRIYQPWSCQGRSQLEAVRVVCLGFSSVSLLPELIRGAYGPAPPIMPELEDEKPKEEEDEQQLGHQASLSFRQRALAS